MSDGIGKPQNGNLLVDWATSDCIVILYVEIDA